MVYKVVPVPRVIAYEGENIKVATDYIQEMINEHARQGWNYYSVESIYVLGKEGCLDYFSTATQVVNTNLIYMLIFCKEENECDTQAPSKIS